VAIVLADAQLRAAARQHEPDRYRRRSGAKLRIRNGSLWASHTVYLPATGTPTRTAAQWWQVSTAAGSIGKVQQFRRIDDPSGANFYAYPTLAVNSNSDVMVGYTHFGLELYPSAGYSTRLASDVPNTMEAGATLKAGEAPTPDEPSAGK